MLIGIDVSKSYVDIAYRTDKKLKTKHFKGNTQQTAQEILDFIKPSDSLQVVMEATGTYHVKLAQGFYDLGCVVYVENPLKIKSCGQMNLTRAKTDSYDAKQILEYGEKQTKWHPWHPRSPEQEGLRQMVKAVEGLLNTKVEIFNRLDALSALPEVNIHVKKSLETIMEGMEKEIEFLSKQIEQQVKVAAGETDKLLRSIPGIGPVSSACLIAQFGSFKHFDNVKQLVASVGLNPAPHQSGSSVRGRKGISKRGHGYLRKVLYMAAISAKRFNPFCKALYERLLEKKVPKMKALIAVAHKLLRQAFGVVKNQTLFSPHFSQKMRTHS